MRIILFTDVIEILDFLIDVISSSTESSYVRISTESWVANSLLYLEISIKLFLSKWWGQRVSHK